MEGSADLVNFISSCLDSGAYKEAMSALNDDKHKQRFSDYCWDLVEIVVGKIQDDTIICRPSLYGACEEIITFIQGKCTPEDALLEFIDRLELSKNDAQFGIILPIIQKLLNRLTATKKRSLEWCLYGISNHIEKIKITEYQLEGDERKLIDSDPNVRRVNKIYDMVIQFYQPFISDIAPMGRSPNMILKPIMVDFLISLLGRPMVYFDVDPNANDKSEARQACAAIILDISKMEKNLLKWLPKLEYKEKQRLRCTDGSDEISPYDHGDRLNLTTYSGYYYIVCSGHFEIPDWALPQVYSNEYLIRSLMIAVNHLLRYSEYGPLNKALALYRALNIRMPENTSHKELTSSIHCNMLKRLVNVTIYCNYQSLRKTALDSIKIHVNKFDLKGRCALIKYLIGTSNHSGVIGYAIILYKDAIIQAFKEPTINECFTGDQLRSMVKQICYLPKGVESDLMELADQIITALNFLRFLVLKDKENQTGIKDLIPMLETEYMDVLVTALKMSKAHYELRMRDIMEGRSENNVPLFVGGNTLNDSIPVEKKKELIELALNGFNLMEALLARLNECIKPSNVSSN